MKLTEDQAASAVREALLHLDELRELASAGTPVLEARGLAFCVTDLERAVARLSPRKRQAVELILIHGRFQKDAANTMRIRTATAAQYTAAGVLQITRELFAAEIAP